MNKPGPIGVFDSGYGGLTILKEFVKLLPQYDYIYLGDNARAPYGTRSFEVVHQYTLEATKLLFDKGCNLVILACNTASAKALRKIQQEYIVTLLDYKRVLGVVRPTSEIIGNFTRSNFIGILGTKGTVQSSAYHIEIAKFFPEVKITQLACPMWVPLVENMEYEGDGADFFVKEKIDELLSISPKIDAVVLGCTHYPMLYNKIRKYLPENIKIINQGEIVAQSMQDYLKRHTIMEKLCSQNGSRSFYTTDDTISFDNQASIYFGSEIKSLHLDV
jgi:glutamate racemase